MPAARLSLPLDLGQPHHTASPRNCPRESRLDTKHVAKPSNLPLPCDLHKPQVFLLDAVCSFQGLSSCCTNRLAIVCLPTSFDLERDDQNEPYVARQGEYQVECATHGAMGRLLLNQNFTIILYPEPFANGCTMLGARKTSKRNAAFGTFDDFKDVDVSTIQVLNRGTRFGDRLSKADGRFPPSYVVEIAATLDRCVEAQQTDGLTSAQCFAQYFPKAVVLAKTMGMFSATMRLWQEAHDDLKHAFISAGVRREGDFRVFLKNAEVQPRMSLARFRLQKPTSWSWEE